MKILVTGGAGFIGSHLVDKFVSLGHRVIVIDNLSAGKKEFINRKAAFYRADIRDKKEVERIIRKEKPALISHHAAQVSVRISVEDPLFDAQVNLLGLINLLEAGRENGLKKVIFASSGGVVYGEAVGIPTPEDYRPLTPLSPYGVSKLSAECYLKYYDQAYGIPFVALRYSNVYGPRQNPCGESGVVAIFINRLLQGLQPVINGDGCQTRDYVYVKDVVKANVLAVKTTKTDVYNIGTGIESDVNKIYAVVRDLLKTEVKAVYGPAKRGEQKRSCLKIDKARAALSWHPETSLEEGVSRTIEFLIHEARQ